MDIDLIIVIGFLIANLAFGVFSSRGIYNIRQYAIGDRNFSALTIAATLIATWIGGEELFTYLSLTYKEGLHFLSWAIMGDVVCLFIIGFIFAPRLVEFLGKLSIAEAMNDLYGKKVRIITAIAGCISSAGFIAIELKVSGFLLNYCFGISPTYGALVAGIIVTTYSTLGGIRSVTFTDAIQLFTFGAIIPLLAFCIFSTFESIDTLTTTLSTNKLFDYKELLNISNPQTLSIIFLFLWDSIPGFNPAIFQRIAIAKNYIQIRKSFFIAAGLSFFITIIMGAIGVMMIASAPGLDPNEVPKHILSNYYSFAGLKGLTIAGIIAMVMSTAGSHLNSTSVLIVHDFFKPLNLNLIGNELLFARISSCIIGSLALIFSIIDIGLVELLIATSSFYMPVVTVPFIMSMFGFRSSSKSVLIGMGAGFITVIIWDFLLHISLIPAIVPAMLANLLSLVGSHYLLRQPGGWVGIKQDYALKQIRLERKEWIHKINKGIKDFKFFSFIRKHSPDSEGMYVVVGIFCMISIFTNMFTLSNEIKTKYPLIVDFIAPSVLMLGTLLLSYPMQHFLRWRRDMMGLVWNLSIFYIFVCISFLLMVLSGFAQMQVVSFVLSLVLIASLTRWYLALFFISFGVGLMLQFCKIYFGVEDINAIVRWTRQIEVSYIVLITGLMLVLLLRPSQERQEVADQKLHDLDENIKQKSTKLTHLANIKAEIISNISHETVKPITTMTYLAENLYEDFYVLPREVLVEGLKTIAFSGRRLSTLTTNMFNLSKLSDDELKVKPEPVDIGVLVQERVEYCERLYVQEENKDWQEFVMELDPYVIINCDKYYISQAIDNVIINAIQYGPKGKITVSVKHLEDKICQISVSDQGIGVPEEELYDIFGAFNVSSYTKSRAGGRGLGLAVAKKVVERHLGSIWADNNADHGLTITMIICSI